MKSNRRTETAWDLTNVEPSTSDSILPHTNFSAAITDGGKFEHPTRGTIVVKRIELGELFLPTGRIVASDPSFFDRPGAAPYVGQVPPGRYPLIGSIAQIPRLNSTDDRLACVVVQFSDATPVYWKMAYTANDNVTEMRPGMFVGYGVDTGTGCFVDAQTAHRIESHPALFEQIMDVMPTERFFTTTKDAETNENIITFSTGEGDGAYPSYWGFAADKSVCCLATDFCLLGQTIEKKLSVDLQSLLQGRPDVTPLKDVGLEIRADFNWSSVAGPVAGMIPPTSLFPNTPEIMRTREKELLRKSQTPPVGHYCCVHLSDGNSSVTVTNAGKTYQPSLKILIESQPKFAFRFDEPLEPTAKLNIEYTAGWESSRFFHPKTDQ